MRNLVNTPFKKLDNRVLITESIRELDRKKELIQKPTDDLPLVRVNSTKVLPSDSENQTFNQTLGEIHLQRASKSEPPKAVKNGRRTIQKDGTEEPDMDIKPLPFGVYGL